jgi:hypothetical protein
VRRALCYVRNATGGERRAAGGERRASCVVQLAPSMRHQESDVLHHDVCRVSCVAGCALNICRLSFLYCASYDVCGVRDAGRISVERTACRVPFIVHCALIVHRASCIMHHASCMARVVRVTCMSASRVVHYAFCVHLASRVVHRSLCVVLTFAS